MIVVFPDLTHLLFMTLCILLLAGGGKSIFDIRSRAPLFAYGVSCRTIPRPILGAPGLGPGLLLN